MYKVIHTKEINGEVKVNLYGKIFDLTDCVQDGKAELRAFGDDYEVIVGGCQSQIEVKPVKKAKNKRKK